MRIAIGSDHAGFALKEEIKKFLTDYEVVDVGTNSTESVDYPDFARKVGELVGGKEVDFGILICGTGIGMSITANKIKGVYAALACNVLTASLARRHNNANVLCIGGRMVGVELAKEMVRAFLSTDFEGGRHERRLNKIKDIENL